MKNEVIYIKTKAGKLLKAIVDQVVYKDKEYHYYIEVLEGEYAGISLVLTADQLHICVGEKPIRTEFAEVAWNYDTIISNKTA